MIAKEKPSTAYIKYLAANLRQSDLEEIKAGSGLPAFECLRNSMEISQECFVAMVKDKPVFIYGVQAGSEGNSVWLLGTDDIDKNIFAFMKFCKTEIKRLKNKYGTLYNLIPESNKKTIAWLKALNAAISPERIYFKNTPKPYRLFYFLGD